MDLNKKIEFKDSWNSFKDTLKRMDTGLKNSPIWFIILLRITPIFLLGFIIALMLVGAMKIYIAIPLIFINCLSTLAAVDDLHRFNTILREVKELNDGK
jgi:hypothetical protein